MGTSYSTSHNGLEIVITLGSSFVDTLKADLNIATTPDDVELVMLSSSITDMNARPVVAVNTLLNPADATNLTLGFTADSTSPQVVQTAILLGEELNHRYRIVFDETIDVSTIVWDKLTLVENECGANCRR